MANQFI